MDIRKLNELRIFFLLLLISVSKRKDNYNNNLCFYDKINNNIYTDKNSK